MKLMFVPGALLVSTTTKLQIAAVAVVGTAMIAITGSRARHAKTVTRLDAVSATAPAVSTALMASV